MTDRGDITTLLRERLLQSDDALPTSALARLGRTARAAWVTGRAARAAAKAPDGIDIEALVKAVTSIGQLKGIAMKAGQIMSYIDVALPDEVRDALSVLQTHAQPMPIERVRAILRDELGAVGDELAATLEPIPVAAASIGQVHRATIPGGQKVAVKVRYPEVEAAIRKDFGPASAASHMAGLLFPKANIKAIIAEARARFLEECDYSHEARAQERFRALYEGHDTVVVPGVHGALSSRGVLTTDFIDGARLDEWLATDPPQEERDHIGVALFEFYLGTLFRHGLYNCDPHPGNYLFLNEKRIAVLDYGCTRAFDAEVLAKLTAVSRAAHRDDRAALHASFVGIGFIREGDRYDFEAARRFVRGYHGPMLNDRTSPIDLGEAMSMKEVAQQKMELLKLTLPGELLFLFRIRFGLMSVLARIGARANWHRLELAAIEAP